MPILEINTTTKVADIPSDFLVETSKTISEMIGKPLQSIAVYLHPEQLMAFGGTTDPCALVSLSSVGKISQDENIKYAKVITEIVGKLGVQPDRMYIIFTDLVRDNVGLKGTTLSGLDKLAGKK
ncbi:macrophage migration inhibitory factor-like [Patiria miniata]|uniref:L-dopachrome isomerase n=1 Tax=Patiria miniata TaxID=46514 RepID=A0A914A0C9_PATMI|nr:macrophage migration inhibitory factor-like [Patiria miniata]XP_038056786.1 macrophage migration inhibitory factor-like [Patiria miniata]XP_038056794.1 macrophage migration inhibitory factor-like [Patiria miniata]